MPLAVVTAEAQHAAVLHHDAQSVRCPGPAHSQIVDRVSTLKLESESPSGSESESSKATRLLLVLAGSLSHAMPTAGTGTALAMRRY
eukprot:248776-Rhodomonas_salina.1